MAELSVEISAKINQFQKGLADALKGFDRLKAENKALEKSFKDGKISADRYYKGIAKNTPLLAKAGKEVAHYKTGINSLGNTTTKASKGIISGNSAMTAFSRTVQDAPFGIMGVSNNITNLTEQFGYLKNKTGSAKGALSAMLRDLKGFGGISLAVSAVTSLLLVFGDKIFKTKDNVKELNKQNEEFVTGLKSLETTLNGLSLSQDQLNSKIEDYILLQKIKANADAQEEKSTEKLKKINENLVKEKEKLASAQNLLNVNTIAYGKSQNKETTRAKGYAKAITNNNNIIAGSTSKITSLEKEKREVILDSLSILKKYREQRNKLKEAIDGSVASLENQKSKLEKEQKQVSVNSKTWQEYAEKIKNVQTQIDNIKGVSSSKKLSTPVFIDFKLDNSSFDEIKQIDLGDNEWIGDNAFDWENYYNLKKLEEVKLKLEERLKAINEGAKNIIENSMANTFSAIGTAIGDGSNNAIQALAQGMGGLLSSMGDYLIKLGTAAVLAGTVVKLFGDISGIGAGLAAIAGGIVLKGIGTAIGKTAQSGSSDNSVSSDTSTFSGSSNSSFNSSGSSGFQNVVFEIQGTKLVGVLSNTLSRNRALGGSLGI